MRIVYQKQQRRVGPDCPRAPFWRCPYLSTKVTAHLTNTPIPKIAAHAIRTDRITAMFNTLTRFNHRFNHPCNLSTREGLWSSLNDATAIEASLGYFFQNFHPRSECKTYYNNSLKMRHVSPVRIKAEGEIIGMGKCAEDVFSAHCRNLSRGQVSRSPVISPL